MTAVINLQDLADQARDNPAVQTLLEFLEESQDDETCCGCKEEQPVSIEQAYLILKERMDNALLELIPELVTEYVTSSCTSIITKIATLLAHPSMSEEHIQGDLFLEANNGLLLVTLGFANPIKVPLRTPVAFISNGVVDNNAIPYITSPIGDFNYLQNTCYSYILLALNGQLTKL